MFRIAYIELYVANIVQSAFYYEHVLGFVPIANSHINFNLEESVSILLQHGQSLLLLTSPLKKNNSVADHVAKHGDGVKNIAFFVDDAEEAYRRASHFGAIPLHKPDVNQEALKAVRMFGDTEHIFISKNQDLSALLPMQFNKSLEPGASAFFIEDFDHIAICVEDQTLDHWINFYTQAFDFIITHQEKVDTGKGGMNSKVVQNQNGKIKLVFVESLPEYPKSQIKEYISFYQGPGVQHIAYLTQDIVNAASKISAKGVGFLNVPNSYYHEKRKLLPEIEQIMANLQKYNILVDADSSGYLYQVFSKPIQTQPTCFFELIQREGNQGFGSKNIIALFKAIELEQELRGSI
jgi:4-hydroxyphenylpyruvate dioxygenase